MYQTNTEYVTNNPHVLGKILRVLCKIMLHDTLIPLIHRKIRPLLSMEGFMGEYQVTNRGYFGLAQRHLCSLRYLSTTLGLCDHQGNCMKNF